MKTLTKKSQGKATILIDPFWKEKEQFQPKIFVYTGKKPGDSHILCDVGKHTLSVEGATQLLAALVVAIRAAKNIRSVKPEVKSEVKAKAEVKVIEDGSTNKPV